MIIRAVKRTLNNAGHIDAKLIDFSEICPKNSSEIGCFLLIVSWRSYPPKFPVKSANFSKNSPLKTPSKFDFFPLKSREIGRFFCEFAPENPAKFCFFFRKISEALYVTKWTALCLDALPLILLWRFLLPISSNFMMCGFQRSMIHVPSFGKLFWIIW